MLFKIKRSNNKPFIKNEFSKAILLRTRMRNRFSKIIRDKEYRRQRNSCVSPLTKFKKDFAKLNEKQIADKRDL